MGRLSEASITAFAEREMERVFGASCPGVFLAGGAYKALLHGRRPRDLDFWAETPPDRALAVETLRSRGARPLEPAPGADRFWLDGLIELSFQVEPMERRLARFDLGLSCVGVARRGEALVALLHPLALASEAGRQVLLIRLADPGLALATLSRARRYAADLDYAVPAEVEASLWGAFLGQDEGARREAVRLLRFHQGEGHQGVADEAEALSPSSRG